MVYFLRLRTLYFWQRFPSHLAVESDTHSINDSVVFDRGFEGRLNGFMLGYGHHLFSVLSQQLRVSDHHDT